MGFGTRYTGLGVLWFYSVNSDRYL